MSTHPFSSNPFSVGAAFPFQNPFAAPEREQVAASAVNEDGSYVMVQSAPHVSSEEVESAHLDAVEVVVKWGDNVLHVEHLSPVRSFTVGEEGADYILSSELLGGVSSLSLVNVDAGVASVSAPYGILVTRTKTDGSVDNLSGAMNMALDAGTKMSFAIPGTELRFEVSAVRAGKKIEKGFLASVSLAAHKFTALSFVGHMAVFAAFAFFMPKMNADDDANISRDNILFMQKMLDASAMREQEDPPQDPGASDSEKTGGQGERAKDEEGMLGKTTPTTTTGRFGIEGRNPNPELQRKADLIAARDFGMVGILNTMAMDKNAPAAAWGADSAQGNDEKSALGNMFGASIDDSPGTGGLGLSGSGEGGGGTGVGIGLDGIGPLGHGGGHTDGQGLGPGGMGIHSGRLQRPHHVRDITIREPGLTANGHLPAEVIQRVVRQNFGRFRGCYEAGLRTNPSLTGRVQVKFVIGRDGAVSVAQDGGSDLPDQGVVSCVVRNYQSLSFPQPDNGIVTVSYPIIFTPGE